MLINRMSRDFIASCRHNSLTIHNTILPFNIRNNRFFIRLYNIILMNLHIIKVLLHRNINRNHNRLLRRRKVRPSIQVNATVVVLANRRKGPLKRVSNDAEYFTRNIISHKLRINRMRSHKHVLRLPSLLQNRLRIIQLNTQKNRNLSIRRIPTSLLHRRLRQMIKNRSTSLQHHAQAIVKIYNTTTHSRRYANHSHRREFIRTPEMSGVGAVIIDTWNPNIHTKVTTKFTNSPNHMLRTFFGDFRPVPNGVRRGYAIRRVAYTRNINSLSLKSKGQSITRNSQLETIARNNQGIKPHHIHKDLRIHQRRNYISR